jgi:hypothetical protein
MLYVFIFFTFFLLLRVFFFLIFLISSPSSCLCVFPCQVALRFPKCVDTLVAGGAACLDKVDGRSWHTDGLRQGKHHSFSLLVGVALSDQVSCRGRRSAEKKKT